MTQDNQLVPNYIRGYRFWTIEDEFLSSLTDNGHRWPNTESIIASCKKVPYSSPGEDCCKKVPHFPPEEDCSCGIYARYSPNDLADLLFSHNAIPDMVVGTIYGFGKIVLGDRGFRSEKARVIAICPVMTFTGHYGKSPYFRASEIAYNYRAVVHKNMDDLVLQFPPENLSALGIRPYARAYARMFMDIPALTQADIFNLITNTGA